MPIAAVPEYIQKTNREFYLYAPPGHRFLLYFAVWGENQETGKVDWRMKDRVPKIDKKTKQQKVNRTGPQWENLPNDQFACTVAACKTPAYDEEKPRARKPQDDPGLKPWKPLMNALLKRQGTQAAYFDNNAILHIEKDATAPCTTGLGNEHPLENGFAFLNPYGLPYLPGSGVKGVLRQAACELASGDWGESHGWSEEESFFVQSGQERIVLSMIDVLFGRKAGDGDKDHVRGALLFWDVIPQIDGDSLMVDIMTPHQSHYYQQNEQVGSTNPHESGQPNPICFLTVPPGSRFTFFVACDVAHLRRLAPALAENDPQSAEPRWKILMRAVFEHAFDWLGFGAKTAVGYGAMKRDEAREEEYRKELEERVQQAAEAAKDKRVEEERQTRLAALDPLDRDIEEVLAGKADKNQSNASYLINAVKQGRWSGDAKRQVAKRLRTMMEEDKLWKEKSQAKRPEKDRDYQNTLLVMSWLSGES